MKLLDFLEKHKVTMTVVDRPPNPDGCKNYTVSLVCGKNWQELNFTTDAPDNMERPLMEKIFEGMYRGLKSNQVRKSIEMLDILGHLFPSQLREFVELMDKAQEQENSLER